MLSSSDKEISIHAPRVGSDVSGFLIFVRCSISIHAPRVGSDFHHHLVGFRIPYFNPRSPCGERRHSAPASTKILRISIHAPRVGSDCFFSSHVNGIIYFNPRSPCGERQNSQKARYNTRRFQSTLPVWGATYQQFPVFYHKYISIHAPRVGSDRIVSLRRGECKHFNPRSPCGERLCRREKSRQNYHFNPRSPCGERLRPRAPGLPT